MNLHRARWTQLRINHEGPVRPPTSLHIVYGFAKLLHDHLGQS